MGHAINQEDGMIKQENSNHYQLKCDHCKTTLKIGVSFKESVEGATCDGCEKGFLRLAQDLGILTEKTRVKHLM